MGPLPALRKDTRRPLRKVQLPVRTPLVLLRTNGGHARFRENVDSALRENDGSAALGLEAAAGDLMVVEDGRREKVAEIRC